MLFKPRLVNQSEIGINRPEGGNDKTTTRSTTINDLTNSHLVRGNGVSKSILRRERESTARKEGICLVDS